MYVMCVVLSVGIRKHWLYTPARLAELIVVTSLSTVELVCSNFNIVSGFKYLR